VPEPRQDVDYRYAAPAGQGKISEDDRFGGHKLYEIRVSILLQSADRSNRLEIATDRPPPPRHRDLGPPNSRPLELVHVLTGRAGGDDLHPSSEERAKKRPHEIGDEPVGVGDDEHPSK
jgi:hypothetical protein